MVIRIASRCSRSDHSVIPSVGIPGLRPTAGGKKREATAEAQRTQSDAEPFSCLCASLRSLRLCGCFWIFRAARDLGGRWLEDQSSRPRSPQVPRYARDDSGVLTTIPPSSATRPRSEEHTSEL